MSVNILKLTGNLLVILSLSGCAALGLSPDTSGAAFPARPILPVVDDAALKCLSDETYKKLLLRDQLRRQYAEQLEKLSNAAK